MWKTLGGTGFEIIRWGTDMEVIGGTDVKIIGQWGHRCRGLGC